MSGPNSEYDPVQVAPLGEDEVVRMRDEALAAIAAAPDLDTGTEHHPLPDPDIGFDQRRPLVALK